MYRKGTPNCYSQETAPRVIFYSQKMGAPIFLVSWTKCPFLLSSTPINNLGNPTSCPSGPLLSDRPLYFRHILLRVTTTLMYLLQ